MYIVYVYTVTVHICIFIPRDSNRDAKRESSLLGPGTRNDANFFSTGPEGRELPDLSQGGREFYEPLSLTH